MKLHLLLLVARSYNHKYGSFKEINLLSYSLGSEVFLGSGGIHRLVPE